MLTSSVAHRLMSLSWCCLANQPPSTWLRRVGRPHITHTRLSGHTPAPCLNWSWQVRVRVSSPFTSLFDSLIFESVRLHSWVWPGLTPTRLLSVYDIYMTQWLVFISTIPRMHPHPASNQSRQSSQWQSWTHRGLDSVPLHLWFSCRLGLHVELAFEDWCSNLVEYLPLCHYCTIFMDDHCLYWFIICSLKWQEITKGL